MLSTEKLRLNALHRFGKVYVGKINPTGQFIGEEDVTEEFKRCVVLNCQGTVEFVVDGVKYQVSCKRVDDKK
ncbi:hypothetical protein ACTFR8_22135 [Bacillus cereus group sp. MYBK15-3]|uniref:hypothetical protein n=1 Tax=Bacillus cereus group TaxID=86661 RepID=UPI001C8B277F|nr:hypothetical protein [Bacillus cereus]MBX9158300.1 hypothetical protein [Bacillus cereus]